MFNTTLLSLRDNLYEKTKNPFLGTYVLVWLIRNWELVFTILNFDDDYQLKEKVNFVKVYYSDNEFLIGLFYNILWTFLILIITYIVLSIARYITNISEQRINPWIYKITDSKLIVSKDLHEKVRLERNQLLENLRKERDTRTVLENRISELEINLKENSKKDKEQAQIIFQKLEKSNRIEDLYFMSRDVNGGEFVEEYSAHHILIELGLIEYVEHGENEKMKKFKFTNLGQNVLNEIRFSEKYNFLN